jgi:hypothetical protein
MEVNVKEVSRNNYYKIMSRDGLIKNFENLEDCMSFLPSSFKRFDVPITRDDLSKRNFWTFEKLEQVLFDDGSDNVDVLEECFYISRHKTK